MPNVVRLVSAKVTDSGSMCGGNTALVKVTT